MGIRIKERTFVLTSTGMADATPSDLALAEAYFDRFVQAFSTFDATKLADLLATPGVALRRDGSLVGVATRGTSSAITRPHWTGTVGTAAGPADGRGFRWSPWAATASWPR
jgi:hypothetical protein